MTLVFYLSGLVAILSTVMVITRLNIAHGLLYLVVSLLSVAMIFFSLGAPFVAALEVIIYAGAIMVLFVFAMMMLKLDSSAAKLERQWQRPRMWIGPSILTAILLGELSAILAGHGGRLPNISVVTADTVGMALFGPYLLATEMASLLLLAGLVGAYHVGRRDIHQVVQGHESGAVETPTGPVAPAPRAGQEVR